jgi:signal transduction histidine kinase
MAPREVRLVPGGVWPLHEALTATRPVLVDDVAARFHGHVAGADGITPEFAFVHPLRDDAEDRIVGMLILGTEPYLPLDDRYREFLTLVSDTIAARMAEAHARQRERQRLERLAELDRAKTEFFSNVSHEFRTPLTLMLGPLEQLLNDGDGLPAERKAELELIRRNARRLLRLVATMLDFSQIEAGRLRARFAPVDLAERTREIVAQFESAAARAGLALRVELEKLPEPVWADVEMWEKIVSNLLSNALKFTFSGEIEVTLRAQPNHAELVIRDTLRSGWNARRPPARKRKSSGA